MHTGVCWDHESLGVDPISDAQDVLAGAESHGDPARSQMRHSEIKARNMQRFSFKYRKQAIANRDPVEWRQSLAKAVKAAAELRRRQREWRERHDTQAYDYDTRRAVKKRADYVHPWIAA